MTDILARDVRKARLRWYVPASALLLISMALLPMFHRPKTTQAQALPPGVELSPEALDLGLLTPTSTAIGTFELANHGNLSYRVNRITPECGCMVARAADQVLAPGRSLKIPITVKGAGWGDGQRTKRVAVKVADSQGSQSIILLQITAAVRESVSLGVIPGHVELSYSAKGIPASFSLFARGDRAVIDRLPRTVELRNDKKSQIVVKAPTLEGRYGTREIVVRLTTPLMPNVEDDTRILEINVSGDRNQIIQIPFHFLKTRP